MQSEKQFLVDEVSAYLDKSDYVFLADFERVTVADTEELRLTLAKEGAEFHVVKNRILKLAAADRGIELDETMFSGPTGLVVGGDNAPGVAKALEKFFKDKKKLEVKGGALEKAYIDVDQVSALAKLPPAEILKAQLSGSPEPAGKPDGPHHPGGSAGPLNVLQAKVDKEGGAA
jgi:large subunit ribosomal protein L10